MGKEGGCWVAALLGETYFGACSSHAAVRKNERNVFCAHCGVAICQHCLPSHPSHSIFQIRRYVYNDVIRLDDIQKLVDCEHVQAYIVNSAKVVFLNQRPQSRPAKGVGNACETCDRILQDGFRFCSLACRVDAALMEGGEMWKSIINAPLPPSNKEANLLSPNCMFPEATSSSHSPSSSVSTANDTTLTVPCPFSHTASKSSSSSLAAQKFLNKAHSITSNVSKLKGNTLSSSHSSKSLKCVSSPVTLKWARTIKCPITSKLAKKLPFTPYSKLSFTSKLPRGQSIHTSKPSYLLEQCISEYPDAAYEAKPFESLACSENSDSLPLPKRRKGMPHRSPIC